MTIKSGVLVVGLVMSLSSFAEMSYKLRFTENFNGKALNEKLWVRIPEGHPDWCKNMSMRKDLVKVKGGICEVRGIKNDRKDKRETRSVLTGGIMTKGKFTMRLDGLGRPRII